MGRTMFETDFLRGAAGWGQYRDAITKAMETLIGAWPNAPYSGSTPAALAKLWAGEILPDEGRPPSEVWKTVEEVVARSISLTHPATIAHLHSPPLIASLAADVVISALNQSMDSFDQGPAATTMELALCDWLCREIGFPADAASVFTSGGTQSNFMGLLLARDACAAARWNWRVQEKGLPPQAARMRFLCSEVAHFTVEKSVYQLGLGTDSVIKVPVDDAFRMDARALAETLAQMKREGQIPAAIVATAGTTDFGSIDPLPEVARLAREAGAWLHVDAAYGSALLLSHKHRGLLTGIERADSVSVDFHKKFWQPISCGAFALRDASQFRHLEMHADYLNPESHDQAGIPDLVSRSLATARRFDALKLWLSFQILGREKFGAMIDRTLELAAYAAGRIQKMNRFELLHQPEMGCVVFRYLPQDSRADADALNRKIRDLLFERGEALLGHTRVHGRQCLKFTCMNPVTTEGDLDALIERIQITGDAIAAELARA
jgi:L-2,4-diaminobutyrate decarboxylase